MHQFLGGVTMSVKRIIFFGFVFLLLIPYVAKAGISIVGGLSHERVAKQDKAYRGVIFIRNTADEPQEVKVYQTDYLFFFDGKTIYGKPGKDPRSNARWINFSPKRFTIPAKGLFTVNYTIKVPDDKTLTGTYWSIIMVQEICESSPQAIKAERGKIKANIETVVRYAVSMVTHIGDTGARKLNFLDTKLLKREKERTLQVDIENIGERWLIPSLWAELYNEEGVYIGRFEGGRRRIYPDTSVRFKVDLSQVPKGIYKALVIADCGGEDVFGATYTLRFEK